MKSGNRRHATPEENIVLFDGICGLCNRWIDFLLKRDKKSRVYYSPLQGELAKGLNLKGGTTDFDTIVYWRGGKCLTKSTAVLKILRELGGIWILTQVFLAVPKFIRDAIYDWIARNRYKIFGKRDVCRIPTAEEQERFLP